MREEPCKVKLKEKRGTIGATLPSRRWHQNPVFGRPVGETGRGEIASGGSVRMKVARLERVIVRKGGTQGTKNASQGEVEMQKRGFRLDITKGMCSERGACSTR